MIANTSRNSLSLQAKEVICWSIACFSFFFGHHKFVFLACCCNLYIADMFDKVGAIIAEPMFDGLNKKLIDHRKARENFNY